VPVVILKDTVFYIRASDAEHSPEERVQQLQQSLQLQLALAAYHPDSLQIKETEEHHDLYYGNLLIHRVCEADARASGMPRGDLAATQRQMLNLTLSEAESNSFNALLRRIGLLTPVLVFFALGIRYLAKLFSWLEKRFLASDKSYLKGLSIRGYELLSRDRTVRLLVGTLRLLRWIATLIFFYFSLPLFFSIFPATEPIATTLLAYVTGPLR